MENHIKNDNFIVSPCIETTLKGKGKRVYIFNTYKILINASNYILAENLRKNFKAESNIDLNDEPLMGK